MSLIKKNQTQREIEVLAQLEKQLERREKRQRVMRYIIGGLSFLAVASYIAGTYCGHNCAKHRYKK